MRNMRIPQLTRRSFLGSLSAAAATLSASSAMSFAARAASSPAYEPWKPGMLDIHHISTGRGNSTLFLCPDGTSMMVDAGAIYAPLEYTIAPKPDGSRRPGEWLGRYTQRHLREAGREELDYFVLTHFHADHMGEVAPGLPLSKDGSYRLTGVADVAEIVPIRRFLDRNYPSYDYPLPLDDPHQTNYIHFIREQVRRGASAQRFQPGSDRQIPLLRKPESYPGFSVRNLVANGEVWTGVADTTRHQFPDLASLKKEDYPSENMCSLALRMSYGKFDYYTGGDLSGSNEYGNEPWRDIETPVAQAAGPVEVAVVNHHGYADADGPGMVRALRPEVFLILAWDSAHPTVNTLGNMLSTSLYPVHRDIFSTAMKMENRISNRRIADFKSQNGHIVVRVARGGESFRIVILDNADEQDRVIAEFGPYTCS
jgi:beta-lactamase superfamily II metal-dependent hydrolase